MKINGEDLRKLRKVYRLSCHEIGALMDVSGRFVAYVERGERLLPDYRAKLLTDELALTSAKLEQIYEIYDEIHEATTVQASVRKRIDGLTSVIAGG